MKNFSYTKTAELSSQITIIESLRKDILLKPLSPHDEMNLQWKAILKRISSSFSFRGLSINEEKIISLLSPSSKKRLSPQDKHILKYKSALDYIYYEWLVSDMPITTDVIKTLYTIGFEGKMQSTESEVDKVLQYIQVNPEHPVIQSAIAQSLFLDLSPFSEDNERFANLIFMLFLYKNGYDLRRLLATEEYFFQTLFKYKEVAAATSKSANLTSWILYATDGMLFGMNRTLNDLNSIKNNVREDDYQLELNERQKAILSLLQQPGLKISNKTVQEMYKVSQITASRDLSKLATVGLILTVGKGRSTYYTKI